MLDDIIQLRKELHQNPELSGEEAGTAMRIKKFIEGNSKAKIVTGLGGNGLAVIYDYSADGPVVMIRCELDALPIEEENRFSHRSAIKGVSHKCGHDGHMAIVAGLALWISKQSFQNGKIILLFQPAEETGEGAQAVLSHQEFKNMNPDYIFALHNIPGEPLKSIVTLKTTFSATVQSVAIYVTGKKCHASEPEKGINPALAMAEMVKSFSTLNVTDQNSNEFTLLTPVCLNMGSPAYGISAGSGELHYTMRTWSVEAMKKLTVRLKNIVADICDDHSLQFKMDWLDYFPAAVNNSLCNELITQSAVANGYKVMEKSTPFRFGEDFGWYSQQHKAAMFGIGDGETFPALHHVDYDFPDEIIETGINMFAGIIDRLLNPSETK